MKLNRTIALLIKIRYVTRPYSSSLLCAITACNHLPFFKIFGNFVYFWPNFQDILPFLNIFGSFSEKSHACTYFLEQSLVALKIPDPFRPRMVKMLFLIIFLLSKPVSCGDLEGDLLIILIDCMIFPSPFLDVTRMSTLKVSFFAQVDSGILCLQNAFLWPMI